MRGEGRGSEVLRKDELTLRVEDGDECQWKAVRVIGVTA